MPCSVGIGFADSEWHALRQYFHQQSDPHGVHGSNGFGLDEPVRATSKYRRQFVPGRTPGARAQQPVYGQDGSRINEESAPDRLLLFDRSLSRETVCSIPVGWSELAGIR